MRVHHLAAAKNDGVKLVMLTAYDAVTAQVLDAAGTDLLLVGDSIGNVMLGHDSTLPVELEEMGAALARMMGRSDLSAARRVELACWFYAMGKMQRWTAAVTRGEFVSDDTLTDLGVYTLMVRRAREAGTWPGGPDRD